MVVVFDETKNKKLTEKEKQEMLDKSVEEMTKKGYRVLSPKEHKKLMKGKKIVFSKQAIEDLKRLSEK